MVKAIPKMRRFISPTRERGTRRHRAIAAFMMVFLLLASFSVSGCKSEVQVQPPVIIRRPAEDKPLTVVMVGDILLGDAARKHINRKGYQWPLKHVTPLLSDASLVVGNLEAPLTTAAEKLSKMKKWSYKVPPEAAVTLEKVGFDTLSLANNHTLDYGVQGLLDTMKALRDAGIQPLGGGDKESEARRGVVYDFGSAKIGLLAYAVYWRSMAVLGLYADEDSPGIAELDEDEIKADIRRLRKYADYIIVFAHWGSNYKAVRKGQREWARRFVNAGADMVCGHHPHIAQSVELIKGKPVIYSLGNFVFGTPGRFKKGKQGYGLVARLWMEEKQLRWLAFTPIAVNNRMVKYQPRPLDKAESEKVMKPLLKKVDLKQEWKHDTVFLNFGDQKATAPVLSWNPTN